MIYIARWPGILYEIPCIKAMNRERRKRNGKIEYVGTKIRMDSGI